MSIAGLEATEASVWQRRLGLEGSRPVALGGRLSLRPSVEVGLRYDGGDAETGAGMDVGAGLGFSDSGTGLAVDVHVRTLLVHEAEGFSERGVAFSLSYDPTPSTPLGVTARVAPSWGGQAQSGAAALWGRETMAGMAHGGAAQGYRLNGEVGYGLPVGGRFVGTPRVGFARSDRAEHRRPPRRRPDVIVDDTRSAPQSPRAATVRDAWPADARRRRWARFVIRRN